MATDVEVEILKIVEADPEALDVLEVEEVEWYVNYVEKLAMLSKNATTALMFTLKASHLQIRTPPTLRIQIHMHITLMLNSLITLQEAGCLTVAPPIT